MPKRVTILGSTGSIGRSALEVIRQAPDDFDVVGLTAHSNAELLVRQIEEFAPQIVAVTDPESHDRVANAGVSCELLTGPDAPGQVAAVAADSVLCAIVGAAGLRPVMSAINAGNRVALANKEPMVMAGPLIMAEARQRRVDVLPVDSEHNAIFQCLQGHNIEDVRCIHLTASGGPFYQKPREALRNVTPEEATQHPTWDMGAKISIDSATLMNKGLEIMEAMWLFDLDLDQIDVVIHPQSVIHSLVEFTDGSILAHLGLTDMKFPIQFALYWPQRVSTPMERLDLTAASPLTFAEPDFSEFPCLRLALQAAAHGDTAPAVLNAANEAAVDAFRQGRLGFLQISDVVEEVLNTSTFYPLSNLETVFAADTDTRTRAAEFIAGAGVHA